MGKIANLLSLLCSVLLFFVTIKKISAKKKITESELVNG